MSTINIQLKNDLKDKLEKAALNRNISANSLIIKALEDFLYIEKAKELREKLSSKYKGLGFSNEQELYDNIS